MINQRAMNKLFAQVVAPVARPAADRPLTHVFVRDLVLDAMIGAYDHERDKPQRVRVNLAGLMIDTGLLEPRDSRLFSRSIPVDAEPVVEWRALTVALLDHIADGLRARLDLSAEELPLAKVLEGGTWAAGRRLAEARRADGAPPFRVESDGTVF